MVISGCMVINEWSFTYFFLLSSTSTFEHLFIYSYLISSWSSVCERLFSTLSFIALRRCTPYLWHFTWHTATHSRKLFFLPSPLKSLQKFNTPLFKPQYVNLLLFFEHYSSALLTHQTGNGCQIMNTILILVSHPYIFQ